VTVLVNDPEGNGSQDIVGGSQSAYNPIQGWSGRLGSMEGLGYADEPYQATGRHRQGWAAADSPSSFVIGLQRLTGAIKSDIESYWNATYYYRVVEDSMIKSRCASLCCDWTARNECIVEARSAQAPGSGASPPHSQSSDC